MRCAVAFLSGYRVDQWVRVSCVFTHRDWRAQRAPSADAVTMDLRKVMCLELKIGFLTIFRNVSEYE